MPYLDIIQGLKKVLAQHRALLSVDEIEAIEEAIASLQQLEARDNSTSKRMIKEVIPFILRILVKYFTEE